MRNCFFPYGEALCLVLLLSQGVLAAPPQTIAESSGYQATSRHEDVLRFCTQLAQESSLVRLTDLGKSHEGRKLPLILLSDPPVSTPREAERSGKLVVFAMGNIHAGEVDGKEALLALARDLALSKDRSILKKIVLILCPIFNADGNEKMAPSNRAHQAGPAQGVGVRVNAQGFDLNRDFVKLESPEVRALVRFLNQWDPAVVIDCHTTNGSLHRYTLTYEGGRCPAGDPQLLAFTRDQLLPEVSTRMEKQTGYRSWFYGNFTPDRSQWRTVLPTPRYGTHYVGLRNRIAILAESYVYAAYKDRVLASRAFVENVVRLVAERHDEISKLLTQARKAPPESIVLRFEEAPQGRPHELLGFVEEVKDGKRVSTGKPKNYEVVYLGGTKATREVKRPYAYLIPASFPQAIETLQRHGLTIEELREDIELDVEAYQVKKLSRGREFQKHQPVSLQVIPKKESRRVPAGTLLVRTAQTLGALAVFLLEPESIDGLTTWNFFDRGLKEGETFPVLRLPAQTPLTVCRIRPLPEDRRRNQPITFEMVSRGRGSLNFMGTPASRLTWLDDGEHFLQTKEGRTYKVHAVTGRCQLHSDPEKAIKALAALPGLNAKLAQQLMASPARRLDEKQTAVLLSSNNDLYYATLDGKSAARLTKSPQAEETPTFSPDAKTVAFVREGNLHVIDVASRSERALTSDGGGSIRNGKASWVYFEELFNRNWQAYWWSPDSKQIAFLRFDESSVPRFSVVDNASTTQTLEVTAYPKAGQPNPLVRLGIVSSRGGPIHWLDLSRYDPKEILITRVGWTPDSQQVFCYIQDRAQTWLDVCTSTTRGGEPRVLFRDKTKAWVEDPGPPTFLKDGRLLFLSERTGWKHLYLYEPDGKLGREVTAGEWEIRQLHRVDEDAGWIYFSATKDGSLGANLYRVRLEGTALTRLTPTAGDHVVQISPKGRYFLDSHSSHSQPTQVRLYHTDGKLARTVDTNPVYVREEYRTGTFELVQIPTPDGFILEGSLLKPPGFDPGKRYPVWFMTYGGPHAPTVRDNWGTGRVRDEMLAQMGFVIFRADPRSASGKGACSTWTTYRQLGVQELKDIETAIDWLTKHPWVDANRIGMSGGSYGGFLTAYALTHSKRFAAGVASASVTDWRNYDSIYTERYMNTPKENPKGYEATSVVRAARNLHGKLLLIHGLMDDNVHAQNTIQLIDALQRAGKDFEVMFYPRSRHSILGLHYQRLVVDFMRRTLRPEPVSTVVAAP